MTQALNDYLNGDSSSESSEKETKKEEVVTTTSDSKSYDSKETSDAFDDLFNN